MQKKRGKRDQNFRVDIFISVAGFGSCMPPYKSTDSKSAWIVRHRPDMSGEGRAVSE